MEVAKGDAHIHHLLQEVAMEKTYEALVFGGPAEEKGQIDAPIERLPLPSLLRRVSSQGKPSLTRYQVLERMGQVTRLALQPVTGRTHQLRVHAAHPEGLNCPIVGDPLYGQPADRLYLHAERLEFRHPVTGQRLQIQKEAPF